MVVEVVRRQCYGKAGIGYPDEGYVPIFPEAAFGLVDDGCGSCFDGLPDVGVTIAAMAFDGDEQ